jgi:calcineurin-like phosphoesterase family protein
MQIFFTADTHFGHNKAVNYVHNGIKIRPWSTVDSQDQTIIDKWNSLVSDDDIVYHMGDVYDTSIKYQRWLEKLKGKKILIKGNLDTNDSASYLKYFDEVYDITHKVCFGEHKFLLSHNYVSIDLLNEYECAVNVHGHLHSDCVQDPRYFCVSQERTNFCPITLENLCLAIKENQIKYIKNIRF